MSDYRRLYVPGGTYFFTQVTHQRRDLFRNPAHIERLRAAFQYVNQRRPFRQLALVVLPDHLHCIWRLPPDDADFSTRWQMVKTCFSRGLPIKPVWQSRFWEHLIRDEDDLRAHLDYLHFNPVKHGLVSHPRGWPHSSFQWYVARGWYPKDWATYPPAVINDMDLE
ncbi:MAG: transposase [Pseudomonadota bacterium]